MARKLCTLFPAYFPSLSWWQKKVASDCVVLLDSPSYSHRSHINRTNVKTVDGKKLLTVPVLRSESQSSPIGDILIDPNSNWYRTHRASLISNYRNAPYFDFYIPYLEEHYSNSWQRLIDLNLAGIKLIDNLLRWKTDTVFSSTLSTSGTREGRVIQLLNQFDCDTYVIESQAKPYFDGSILELHGYKIEEIPALETMYEQQFSGFIANLSILDLILNEGPYSVKYLKSVAEKNSKKQIPNIK